MPVRVQEADFDLAAEVEALIAGRPDIGAVVTFQGLCRGGDVAEMELEHYPGMTEAALAEIEARALERFDLAAALIVHRVGRLRPGERIMMVATAARHRGAAFEAAEFLMDWLKSRAPFWKRETTAEGTRWVDARDADEAALTRWG